MPEIFHSELEGQVERARQDIIASLNGLREENVHLSFEQPLKVLEYVHKDQLAIKEVVAPAEVEPVNLAYNALAKRLTARNALNPAKTRLAKLKRLMGELTGDSASFAKDIERRRERWRLADKLLEQPIEPFELADFSLNDKK